MTVSKIDTLSAGIGIDSPSLPSPTRLSEVLIAPPMRDTCLLCRSTDTLLLEVVPVALIVRCYRLGSVFPLKKQFADTDSLRYCLCRDCDLRFFSPAVTGSEQFYEALQKYEWYYLDEKREYSMAAAWITGSSRVLEVGCGRGAFAAHASAREYTGLEFSGGAVRQARETGLNVLQESVESHSLRCPASYDVVCSFQVLEHVSGVHEFLAASVGCLKPGGLLIVCVPSGDSYLKIMTNAALNLPPHHVSHWSDLALTSIGRLFGLALVDLNHEPLAECHRRAAAAAFVQRVLNRLLRRAPRAVDPSLTQRVVGKVSYIAAKYCLGEFAALFPRGHSVVAVYRKQAPAVADSRG